MNSPGQKFVDDFNSQELAPLLPVFLKSAYIVYAHSVLQQQLRLGIHQQVGGQALRHGGTQERVLRGGGRDPEAGAGGHAGGAQQQGIAGCHPEESTDVITMNEKIPAKQYAVQLVGPDQLVLNKAKDVFQPGPHQVLARVEVVGLCFSDLKLLKQFTGHVRKGQVVAGVDLGILKEIPSYVPEDGADRPGT